MISSDVLLGSQDILDDSSWGPQKRFFGFSFGGYVEGGAQLKIELNSYLTKIRSIHVQTAQSTRCFI